MFEKQTWSSDWAAASYCLNFHPPVFGLWISVITMISLHEFHHCLVTVEIRIMSLFVRSIILFSTVCCPLVNGAVIASETGLRAPVPSLLIHVAGAENAIHVPIPHSDRLALNVYLMPTIWHEPSKLKSLIDGSDELIMNLEISHGPKSTVRSFVRHSSGLRLLIEMEPGFSIALEDLSDVMTGLKLLLALHHPTRLFKFDIFRVRTHIGTGDVEKSLNPEAANSTEVGFVEASHVNLKSVELSSTVLLSRYSEPAYGLTDKRSRRHICNPLRQEA